MKTKKKLPFYKDDNVHVLCFNFILGSIFIFLCFVLIIIHYHTQKQRKIKIEPRIKLNHNTCVHVGDLNTPYRQLQLKVGDLALSKKKQLAQIFDDVKVHKKL